MSGSSARRAVATCAIGVLVVCVAWLSGGCTGGTTGSTGGTTTPKVLADTSFMADIAQNVAGDRLSVSALIPTGVDPHSFEPTPRDATRLAESDAFILNSRGMEPLVDDLVYGAGRKDLLVIEEAAGLPGVTQDPHFWMDPTYVITYAENISHGLAALDPEGADIYSRNAQAYADKLRELDRWIAAQVETIRSDRRELVTNHESLGHFAKRYGFTIVGTILGNVTGEGVPSARELATLITRIKASGTPAVFLEVGNNADLAAQVAEETGVKVVADLYIHSLGPHASTYIDMMRWDVQRIVETLR